MASSKGYLDFILEQLSELEDISHRAMMGEYIIYYRGTRRFQLRREKDNDMSHKELGITKMSGSIA